MLNMCSRETLLASLNSSIVFPHITAELRKRGKFDGFSEERMKSLLEGMWNKVEYALNELRKMAGQLKEYSDSKGMKSVLNGSTSKYHFGGSMFHVLPQSSTFFHILCLTNFLQVLLIDNKIDQVPPFRYINWEV